MIRNILGICHIAVILSFFTSITTVQAYSNDPYVYQTAYELVGVYDAWKHGTGSKDVVVAVIDNGFDHYHPDLVQNVWKNTDEIPNNNIDDDNNGYIDDIVGWNFVPEDLDNNGVIDEVEEKGNNNPRPTLEEGDDIVSGHGTAVAGIIGATGYNKYLGAGINWRVSLMNIKIVGNSGSGTIEYVPEAIRYAVDNGADVISMSIVGILSDPERMNDAIAYAYAHDVVIVAAAGNTIQNLDQAPLYPICSDAASDRTQVIGVSAVALNRSFARFSNYGGTCIDITAPGMMISSTVRYGDVGNPMLTEPYRGMLQGTSFATPFVAGTAALIRSTYPRLSAPQVIRAILESTSKTPTSDAVLYANLFGNGLLQVDAALERARAMALQTDVLAMTDTAGTLYQLAPQISMVVAANHRTYYVGTQKTRQVVQLSADQVITQNEKKTLAYVLSAYDTVQKQYTIGIYHTRGVKLRDIIVPTERMISGIFMKDDHLYAFTRTTSGIQTYAITEEGIIPDVFIDVPQAAFVTYDSERDRYLIQQYTRTLTAWTPETGIITSQFIPTSFGIPQFVIALGGTIVTQFEDVGVVWNGAIDAIQIFSYITQE